MESQAVAILIPMHPGECDFWVGVEQPDELQDICMPGPANTLSRATPHPPNRGPYGCEDWVQQHVLLSYLHITIITILILCVLAS